MRRNDNPSPAGDIGRSPAGIRASFLLAASIVGAACVNGMAGCAIHWERAFYEGWRNANQRGTPADGAPVADAPQRLPSYEQYERERQRARGTTAPASGASAPAAPAASEPLPS